MAKMKLIHPLSLLLCLWGMAGVGVCQITINYGVAAVVNSEAITLREVLAQTQMEEDDLRVQQQAGKITDDERKQMIKSRRKTVLDSLIETRLIVQDYKKKGYNFPDYLFTREEKSQIRDRFGGDRQTLVKTLEEQGKTMEDWRKYIRDTFIVQQMRLINQRRFITISPHMIEAYYQEHVRDFLTFERVKLRMIYLSPESGSEVEALGKEVLGQLELGADFAQLANKYSDYNRSGGGLFKENGGWVERGGLKSELAEVAFKLRPGQASGLLSLPTAQGTSAYYILMVEDVRKATAIPIESARGGIESTLTA
jgi:parvulin-like peptidyl-prolyl isomerase